MEHSSPLAAMQPPSVLLGHYFRPEPPTTSYPQFNAVKSFGPNSFNFQDLSMKKSNPDYFAMKPVRGSSPTASLAADLSQNFHIDQSPQLATPRRSLFSANLFGPGSGRDNITTPPLPSSSPAPAMDCMEISPLPHKAPFSLSTDADLQSPTPELSSGDSSMLSIPSPLMESPLDPPKPVNFQEKKKPSLRRPSLSRTKAYSTNWGSSRRPTESQLPPFKFGNGASKLSTTSVSLSDIFDESPAKERPPPRNLTNHSMGPPRPRHPFAGVTGHSRGNGSPAPGHYRKSSNPFFRPRKQSRRSLSMFENPGDVMKQEESQISTDESVQSISDIDAGPTLTLPHFIPDDQPDCLPRLEKDVLVDLLNGKYNDRYENLIIIDCRFEYEYEGGHISGAVNYNDKDALAANLFDQEQKPNTILVFHCEYSAHRAPIMAKFIRHKDRAVNVDHYPKLTYPEMYILDGGYSAFFAEHRSLCFPENYVEMAAKEHAYACERGLGKVKQRSKLARAQTFAFGQQSPQMEDSPTGRCRNANNDRNLSLDIPFGQNNFGPGRVGGRRMFSY